MPLLRAAALAVTALALLRAALSAASGDLDHAGGGVVLVVLALVLVTVAALFRDELGGAARVLVMVAALGCALAAWGDIGLARAVTVGEADTGHQRIDAGGAVISAGVAAAAVAALVGRRTGALWALAAIGLSLAVPPYVAPAAGLPLLLLGLRQRSVESPPSTATT